MSPSWPARTAWTAEHERAFTELDARTRLPTEAPFELRWPDATTIDAWIDAALLDVALSCTEDRPARFASAHVDALITQAKRGFGWATSTQPDRVRAAAAIGAALLRDADRVVSALGGAPLARSVSAGRLPNNLGGLVRRIATAAQHGLGEDVCGAALRALPVEPVFLFALARLALEGAGGHARAEVPARFATWLHGAGSPLAEGAATPPRAAPKRRAARETDDPRVSIFERFMLVLSDPSARAGLADEARYLREERALRGWDAQLASFVARAWVFGADDVLAACAPTILALSPQTGVYDPTPARPFLAMLGHPSDDWEAALRAELRPFHKPKAVQTLRRYRWSTGAAAVALTGGDTALVASLTGGTPKKFRAGQAFGDDARAVLQYFALGLACGASVADVTPAFLGLLASRTPTDVDRALTGGPWSWASLACLAFVYFHRFEGAPANEVPGRLRGVLTGEAAASAP